MCAQRVSAGWKEKLFYQTCLIYSIEAWTVDNTVAIGIAFYMILQ